MISFASVFTFFVLLLCLEGNIFGLVWDGFSYVGEFSILLRNLRALVRKKINSSKNLANWGPSGKCEFARKAGGISASSGKAPFSSRKSNSIGRSWSYTYCNGESCNSIPYSSLASVFLYISSILIIGDVLCKVFMYDGVRPFRRVWNLILGGGCWISSRRLGGSLLWLFAVFWLWLRSWWR